jgi:hypothetical protein
MPGYLILIYFFPYFSLCSVHFLFHLLVKDDDTVMRKSRVTCMFRGAQFIFVKLKLLLILIL